jgi:hypothetical protein
MRRRLRNEKKISSSFTYVPRTCRGEPLCSPIVHRNENVISSRANTRFAPTSGWLVMNYFKQLESTSLDVGDSKCKARTKNCGLQLMDKTLTDLIFNGLKTALLKDTLSPANTISNLTINYIKKGEKIL